MQFPYTILVPHRHRAMIVDGVGYDADDLGYDNDHLHTAYEVTDFSEETALMQHVAERKDHQWTTVLELLRTARRERQAFMAYWLRENNLKLPAVPVMATLADGDKAIFLSRLRS